MGRGLGKHGVVSKVSTHLSLPSTSGQPPKTLPFLQRVSQRQIILTPASSSGGSAGRRYGPQNGDDHIHYMVQTTPGGLKGGP